MPARQIFATPRLHW